jgi:hypothetical protein
MKRKIGRFYMNLGAVGRENLIKDMKILRYGMLIHLGRIIKCLLTHKE